MDESITSRDQSCSKISRDLNTVFWGSQIMKEIDFGYSISPLKIADLKIQKNKTTILCIKKVKNTLKSYMRSQDVRKVIFKTKKN